MSAQTGEEVPAAPVSTRTVDKARFRLARVLSDPNPIWMREMRQSARLTRTPVVLMVITILMALVIASVGGYSSSDKSVAEVGVLVYQTFFSLAFFLVAWLGPGVAANSIASEREGKTWEAILLTGLKPQAIARGKFFAAMTAISTYLVMLAPVGALAFLFGGVTATEVIIAFVYLFLFSILFVALGLAISSKMSSLRGSILVTLLVCVPLGILCFGALGISLSEGIHELWRQVPRGKPVWLPTAYVRGELGKYYWLLLVAFPVVVLGVPTWFLYESVIANLKGHNEDRSTGMKRWFVFALLALVALGFASVLTAPPSNVFDLSATAVVALSAFLAFAVLVFAGEPVGPSRRVRAEWAKARKGAFTRFFGPSAVNAAVLVLVLGEVVLGVTSAVFHSRISPPFAVPGAGTNNDAYVALVGYAMGFFAFLVGFGAWIRVRVSTPFLARILVVVTVAAVSIIPWVVAAIAGALAHETRDAGVIIAAPSPIYAFYMMAEITRIDANASNISAGFWLMSLWAVLGVGFLGAAHLRSRRLSSALEAAQAETDRQLEAEDEASRRAPDAPLDVSAE